MPDGVAAGGGTIRNNAGAEITGGAFDGTGIEAHGILIDASNGGDAVAATTIFNSGLIRGYTGYAGKIVGTYSNAVTNNVGGTIRGAGALSVGAAIQTGDGNDTVTNYGAIRGDNGAAIDLQGGDDMLFIPGGSASIIGDIAGGAGSNMLVVDPGTGNNFSYDGVISNFAVEARSGKTTFAGSETVASLTISGGAVVTLGGTMPANDNGFFPPGEERLSARDGALDRSVPEPMIPCLITFGVATLLKSRPKRP